MERPVLARIKCRLCRKIVEFHVRRSALDARSRGVPHEEAHAYLAEEHRSMLVDHVCPECRARG